MASTYTANSGIEKIGAGEQAGTWGVTTNNNLDILDRAISGVGTITLTGTTTDLTTNDGVLSEGGNKVLVLAGSPSGTNTITIGPNDQDKMYFVQNGTNQSVIFSQGGGDKVTVVAGAKTMIYADGSGSSANVVDLTVGLNLGSLTVAGTAVTTTGAELNIIDGGATVGTTAVAAGDGIVTNDGGTMQQTSAATFSTFFNANVYAAPSAIASTATLTPGAAQSIYQRVDTSNGNITLTLAVGSLAIGQYIIVDKTSTSNTLTIAYAANSTGVSLGNSADFAIAINNGTAFSFVETVKS